MPFVINAENAESRFLCRLPKSSFLQVIQDDFYNFIFL